ncbi:MAG: hypothetical protein ACE5K0_02325 [Candidatus Methanofastidiosia archaeon]
MKDPIYAPLEGQFSCIVEDNIIGFKGFIVFDSNINGKSIGGLMMSDTSLQEIIDFRKIQDLIFLNKPKRAFGFVI